jgi:uncharacterized cupredoxin-like copper-binding protein
MSRSRIASTVLALGLVALLLGGCSKSSDKDTDTGASGGGVTVTTAGGGTTVKVVLGDTKGTKGPMTLVATPATVKPGKVTFEVTNSGTIKHEAVLLKEDTPFDQMTVTKDKVSEKNNVGEKEVEKGETKSFTVDLKSGKYILVCNIAKHYAMGMRAAFTVS